MKTRILACLVTVAVNIAGSAQSDCPPPPIVDSLVTFSGAESGCNQSSPCRSGEVITLKANLDGIVPPDCIYTFDWDFGDGQTGQGNPTAHVFFAAGAATFIVKLTITGAGAAQPYYAFVHLQPFVPGCHVPTGNEVGISYVGIQSGCSPAFGPCRTGETIQFSPAAFGYDFNACAHTFNWSFGDGMTSAGQTVSHYYNYPGTYPVMLQVTNSMGAVTISTPLPIDTGIAGTLSPKINYFFASATRVRRGEMVTLTWSTKDVNFVRIDPMGSQFGANGSYTFAPEHTQSYSLVAFDAAGTLHSDPVLVTVDEIPVHRHAAGH